MKLQGRVAIVTGGGRGIGRAIAMALGHAGAAVSVADIDWPSAQDTAGAVSANGGRATTMMVDIRKEAGRLALTRRRDAARRATVSRRPAGERRALRFHVRWVANASSFLNSLPQSGHFSTEQLLVSRPLVPPPVYCRIVWGHAPAASPKDHR